MTDPPRLLEHEADELERDMLLSGLRDGPSSSRRRAIAAGLGVGMGSVLSIASAARASVASAGKAGAPQSVGWLSHLVRAPWMIGGVVGAAAITAGVSFWPASQSSPPAASAASSALTAPLAQPAVPQAKPSRLDEPPPNVPGPAIAQPPSVTESRARALAESAPAAAPSLADELAMLETARRALVRGESRRTLILLDEHARSFRRPRLLTEASVLRIEALVASGDRPRASRLGMDFLAKHANGPYERRVRSLIGDQRSAGDRTP